MPTGQTHKKLNGQFFTTNSDYILQGLEVFVKEKEITDPFAGNRDLMRWAVKHKAKKAVGFEIDPKLVDERKKVFYGNSINQLKKYKFIITNPPYLHKNKASREVKEKFFKGANSKLEDLYQVSIFSLLNCQEGILIVPLNFLSANNSQRIRNLFFDKFAIQKLNVFTEPVFEDTTYNVIAFYFKRKKEGSEKNKIGAAIFPEGRQISFTLEKRFNWLLGGEFLEKVKAAPNRLGIFRLTEDLLAPGSCEAKMALQHIKDTRAFKISRLLKTLLEKNILFLRAIDSKNGKKIQLEDIRKYNVLGLVGKSTSRNMAHLIFKKELTSQEQELLMERFNQELSRNRQKYFSFFLTNFRDNNRKRISFDFVYKFLNYLYAKEHQNQPALL